MTAQMHKIEQELIGKNGIRLVSISVDPARDTPAVLNSFAQRFGGATDQWIFLTGTPESVHKVAYDTFHVGDVIGKIEHSTKFVLVDKHGHIRGYYSSFDPESLQSLVSDARALESSAA
jgi:cytochrome oxidase Cu insertion factor (SCO1/SenC/PrrC family)